MGTPYNQDFFNKIAGTFDNHVAASIPAFKEVQRHIARNIAINSGCSVLDICGSAGELGRVLLQHGFKGEYTCLDGSKEMQDVFSSMSYSDHLRFVRAGFMTGWDDVPEFITDKHYDYAVESLGFQFFTKSRRKEVREMKRLASTCIFFEKFSTNPETFEANERLKDAYKLKSFTSEELQEKKAKVLDPMHAHMYDVDDFEEILDQEFRHVYTIAQIGNFRAFLCTNDFSVIRNWFISFDLLVNKYNAPVKPVSNCTHNIDFSGIEKRALRAMAKKPSFMGYPNWIPEALITRPIRDNRL